MLETISCLTVARPRVLRVERADPFRISCGDRATIEVGPGLQRLLTLTSDDGSTLAGHYAAEWTIPVGAGATAAYSVIERTGIGSINPVTGARLSAAWKRPATTRDTLEATAVLESTGRSSLRFSYQVTSREPGDELLSGSVVLVVVAEGGTAQFLPEFYSLPRAGVPAPSGPPAPASPTAPAEPVHAVVGAPLARTSDGSATLHRITVVGGTDEPSPEKPIRLEICPPVDGAAVIALTLYHCGHKALVFGPGYPGWPAFDFAARSRVGYELEVRHRVARSSGERVWVEEPELQGTDLLRIAGPSLRSGTPSPGALPSIGDTWEWNYPADVLRLLGSPVAGATEPLGRRVHPFGLVSMAATIEATRRVLPDGMRPGELDIEWARPVDTREDLVVGLRAVGVTAGRAELEGTVTQGGEVVAKTRARFVPALP